MNFFKQDIAIDLGTANFLIIQNDNVIVDEPSVVALDRLSNKPVAFGGQARLMEGKTHDNIRTIRPLRGGVIADFHAAEQMMKGMIGMMSSQKKWFAPSLRMVVCIPSGITEVEKRAVQDSAEIAGAKELYLIHEPMAAAVGMGLNVQDAHGNMIIDIGGGTTEIAVIALSGIVCDQSIRVAGDDFDNDIIQYIRREHNILIGQPTAERIKIAIGAALTDLADMPEDYPVKGRDLLTGMPKKIMVSSMEIAHCLDKSISKIEESVMKVLEMTPPELSGDIYKTGIYLTGGGALLRGLDKRLSLRTKLVVHVAEDPLRVVARGAGMALKNVNQCSFLMQ
jgi:rod shape-determining protein MreB